MNGSTIKLRAEADPAGNASVRLLVNHPMLPQRVDQETGRTQAPHHVEVIVIDVNGETALVIDCGPGVAANPFFSFKLAGVRRGDRISVKWTDNRQQSDQLQAMVA